MANQATNIRELSFQNVLDSILKPAGVKVGGFPEEIFLDMTEKEKEDWVCNICYLIVNDCRECANKHLFCHTCIFAWTMTYGENSQKCPVCRHVQTDYKANREVELLVKDRRVKCPEKGCEFKSPLKIFLMHGHGRNKYSNDHVDLETLRPQRPLGSRMLVLPSIDLDGIPANRATNIRQQLQQSRLMIHQMMMLLHLEMQLRQQALASYSLARDPQIRLQRLDEVLALNEQLNEVGGILSALLNTPLQRIASTSTLLDTPVQRIASTNTNEEQPTPSNSQLSPNVITLSDNIARPDTVITDDVDDDDSDGDSSSTDSNVLTHVRIDYVSSSNPRSDPDVTSTDISSESEMAATINFRHNRNSSSSNDDIANTGNVSTLRTVDSNRIFLNRRRTPARILSQPRAVYNSTINHLSDNSSSNFVDSRIANTTSLPTILPSQLLQEPVSSQQSENPVDQVNRSSRTVHGFIPVNQNAGGVRNRNRTLHSVSNSSSQIVNRNINSEVRGQNTSVSQNDTDVSTPGRPRNTRNFRQNEPVNTVAMRRESVGGTRNMASSSYRGDFVNSSSHSVSSVSRDTGLIFPGELPHELASNHDSDHHVTTSDDFVSSQSLDDPVSGLIGHHTETLSDTERNLAGITRDPSQSGLGIRSMRDTPANRYSAINNSYPYSSESDNTRNRDIGIESFPVVETSSASSSMSPRDPSNREYRYRQNPNSNSRQRLQRQLEANVNQRVQSNNAIAQRYKSPGSTPLRRRQHSQHYTHPVPHDSRQSIAKTPAITPRNLLPRRKSRSNRLETAVGTDSSSVTVLSQNPAKRTTPRCKKGGSSNNSNPSSPTMRPRRRSDIREDLLKVGRADKPS